MDKSLHVLGAKESQNMLQIKASLSKLKEIIAKQAKSESLMKERKEEKKLKIENEPS